ncbi:MAG: tail fiber domain-containing protein [Candidatus Pelethousia sp.]|nr:tail fiber domain-containing protein [Candidatus Pelethousia sp.]
MEPWTNEIKALYKTPGAYKEYRGYSNGELVFDGSNIVADSLIITQSISDSEQIRYGTTEASMLEVRLADSGSFPISIAPAIPLQLATSADEPIYTALPENKKYMLRTDELKGAEIELKQVIGEEEVPIGVFIVDECTREADTWFIKIVAYDRLYWFRQDVAAWYNGLTFPMLLQAFRESLCAYIGIPYEHDFLANDAMPLLEKTIEPASITGATVLSAICELNAAWPQIAPDGTLRWAQLGTESCETFDYEVYEQTYRPESTRADYESKGINAVVIREAEDDIGGHYPETLQDNPYIIQDNFLCYGRSTEDLSIRAQNIYNRIANKPYKPHGTIVDGRPYLQCGDKITVRTQKGTFDTYILKRTLKGEASLVDSLEAQGTQKQTQDYDVSQQIIQLRSKTNKLIRTVDETASEVAKKVGNDEIISRINQTAEEIKILAQKIALEGTVTANSRFKILTDGSMEAVNGKFAGSLDGVTGNFNSLVCDGGEIDFRSGGETKLGIGVNSYGYGSVFFDANTVIEYYNGALRMRNNGEVQVEGTVGLSNLSIGYLGSSSLSSNARIEWVTGYGYQLKITSSSKRYKKNIHQINEPTLANMIDAVPAVTYESRLFGEKGHASYGFIAEEMEKRFPWLVEYVVRNGFYEIDGVQYDRVPAILWADAQNTHAKLKRQDAEIEELKANVEQMHGEIAELKAVITMLLEGRVDNGATVSK